MTKHHFLSRLQRIVFVNSNVIIKQNQKPPPPSEAEPESPRIICQRPNYLSNSLLDNLRKAIGNESGYEKLTEEEMHEEWKLREIEPVEVSGDGNCFYHSLAQLLEGKYKYWRKTFTDLAKENQMLKEVLPEPDYENFMRKHERDTTWA